MKERLDESSSHLSFVDIFNRREMRPMTPLMLKHKTLMTKLLTQTNACRERLKMIWLNLRIWFSWYNAKYADQLSVFSRKIYLNALKNFHNSSVLIYKVIEISHKVAWRISMIEKSSVSAAIRVLYMWRKNVVQITSVPKL